MVSRRERRAAARAKERAGSFGEPAPYLGREEENSRLHAERLDAVVEHLLDEEVTSVLDLGCGSGSLLRRLVPERRLTRIVGVEASPEALALAGRLLAEQDARYAERVILVPGSIDDPDLPLPDCDAAAMVEVIEHFPPERLSVIERVVFAELRPRRVVITTPNRAYNVLLGLAPGAFRHPDHHFEWEPAKFRAWAAGVGRRHGYDMRWAPIGPEAPVHGAPSQMAVFTRTRA